MTKEKENTKPCLNKDEKGSPEDVTVNRRYKDNLFRFIFNDKKKLLGLYNALNHSNYEDPEELELKVTMININYGKNKELMDACKDLRDYAFYVQKVRDYAKIMDIEAAVDKAIEECIKNDVLTDILTKFKAEVKMVSLTEYDKELHEQTLKEESWEEGWESGKLETLLNIVRKKMEKGKSIEVIAEELETEKDKIERIYEVIKSATPDSTQEELLKILLS